jgi:hypothetical protein
MSRELKTAEEIRAEVQRRVDERVGKGRDSVTVPEPSQLDVPDEGGCNWFMGSYAGNRTQVDAVGVSMLEVKAIWNLQD